MSEDGLERVALLTRVWRGLRSVSGFGSFHVRMDPTLSPFPLGFGACGRPFCLKEGSGVPRPPERRLRRGKQFVRPWVTTTFDPVLHVALVGGGSVPRDRYP